MREVIDQTISLLIEATGERQQHPLYRAIAEAARASPDDTGDLGLFNRNPERYEGLLRDMLKRRLAQDPALLGTLRSLLPAAAAPAASSTHQLNIGGNSQVGTAVAGNLTGGIRIDNLSFDKKVFNTAAAPDRTASERTAPAPRPAALDARRLDATLSADGVHFTYGHALLIGVGTYENWQLSAPATAADAELLAAMLRDRASAAYLPNQVTLLSGDAATRDGILQALDDFAAQLAKTPQATALLFFAGHGISRESSYYLVPYDYDRSSPSTTAIDLATFRAKIDAIADNAQKLLVLLNCCHAGGVGDGVLADPGEASGTAAPPKHFYEPLAEGSGRVVISSSKSAERSGARSNQHPAATVFGAQMLAALGGQAPGGGSAVGVFELFGYLSRNVPLDAREIIDPFTNRPLEQHPLIYARQVDQDFPVTLRPGQPSGTLSASLDETIAALAKIEMRLALYDSEHQAPGALVAERDRLLAQLS